MSGHGAGADGRGRHAGVGAARSAHAHHAGPVQARRHEATYRGSLQGWTVHDYRFSAREGQLLNARLDSPSPHVKAVITYIGRDGVRVNPVDNPVHLEQQTLPYSSRYEIRVLQTRNGARRGGTRPYTLNISIVDPGASSAAAPNVVDATPQLTRAPWINYRCNGGQRVAARYHYGEATARASAAGRPHHDADVRARQQRRHHGVRRRRPEVSHREPAAPPPAARRQRHVDAQ